MFGPIADKVLERQSWSEGTFISLSKTRTVLLVNLISKAFLGNKAFSLCSWVLLQGAEEKIQLCATARGEGMSNNRLLMQREESHEVITDSLNCTPETRLTPPA